MYSYKIMSIFSFVAFFTAYDSLGKTPFVVVEGSVPRPYTVSIARASRPESHGAGLSFK